MRLARQATRIALAAWRLAYLEETAALLVSELVTNVVLHTRGGVGATALELETMSTWLRIEIQDADPRWPQPRTPAGFDESGFGFILVDAPAAKWGVREMALGKAVWAELNTRQAVEPGPSTRRGVIFPRVTLDFGRQAAWPVRGYRRALVRGSHGPTSKTGRMRWTRPGRAART